MTAQISKSEQDERGLLPYPVIIAATKGDPEAMNAHRDTKQRQLREVTFSDLSPLEEKQLYVCDEYFADDEAEQSFVVGGKEITAKLLAEALHSVENGRKSGKPETFTGPGESGGLSA